MSQYPESVQILIDRLARYPGIGRKTAQRLALHTLMQSSEEATQLAKAILDVKATIIFCTNCGSLTEEDPCHICTDPKRNQNLLCIVENPSDIFVFERTNTFRGLYHVLGGVLSPLDGIGPEDLNLDSLLTRIKPKMEIILATNPSVEGDTTALYLSKLLRDKNVKISRLARGIPVGSDLEFTDAATLSKAMEGRTEL
ncbi:MAG: recombination mediator RecR [Fidelibacterota bacterium]